MSSVRNSHFSFKPPTPTTFLAREIVELEKSKLDGRSAHFGVPYRFYVGTKTEFFDFIEQNRIFDSLGEDLGPTPMKNCSSTAMAKKLRRHRISLRPATIRWWFARGAPRNLTGFVRFYRKKTEARRQSPKPAAQIDEAWEAIIRELNK